MILLTCPDCDSAKIKRCEDKIGETGEDIFHCTSCGIDFPLQNASHRVENDLFD